jgi:very-short-patch-repair endonuclease
LNGYKFRRQHPLSYYIVDFVCLEKGLIIEVDGGQHDKMRKRDEIRTKWLEQQGFLVLRFWNNEVLNNIENVADTILRTLEERC